MANHKSSEKRAKQTQVKTERNKVRKSIAKNLIKNLRQAISAKDMKVASDLLPKAQSALQRAVKTGVIKKNNASRRISRLHQQLKSLG